MTYNCLLVLKLVIADWSLYEDVTTLFTKRVEMSTLPSQGTTLYLSEPLDLYSINRKVESIGYHPTSDVWILQLDEQRITLKDDRHTKHCLTEFSKFFQLHFSPSNDRDKLKFDNLLRKLNLTTQFELDINQLSN